MHRWSSFYRKRSTTRFRYVRRKPHPPSPFTSKEPLSRSGSDEDHTRALNTGINDPPKEWKLGKDLVIALVKMATDRRE